MITRAEARADATARLRPSTDPRHPTAALDADLLLAHVCGVTKEVLYAHLDAPMTADELARYSAMVERRAAGEPVAYLRGYKEFFGLRFTVDPRVLIPRPETEVLVEAVLAFARDTARMRIVDVGTGSGAIAVAIAASEPRARVIATDVSGDALDVARANAAANGRGRTSDRRADIARLRAARRRRQWTKRARRHPPLHRSAAGDARGGRGGVLRVRPTPSRYRAGLAAG